MRTRDEYERVSQLLSNGLNQCEVSRQSGIPRGTIRDWIKRGFCPRTGTKNDLRQIIRIDPASYLARNEDLKRAYSFVLGEYLGDGCIRTINNTYRLDIYNDKKYEGLNRLIEQQMKIVFPENRVTRINHGGCWDIAVYSNQIPNLFPQMGKGKKHDRKIQLTTWQSEIVNSYPHEFIRGLFYSDGCIYQHAHDDGKYVYTCYHFINKSRDIIDCLTRSLAIVGIIKDARWDVKRKIWVINIYDRERCNKLAEFIPSKQSLDQTVPVETGSSGETSTLKGQAF